MGAMNDCTTGVRERCRRQHINDIHAFANHCEAHGSELIISDPHAEYSFKNVKDPVQRMEKGFPAGKQHYLNLMENPSEHVRKSVKVYCRYNSNTSSELRQCNEWASACDPVARWPVQ